VSAGYLRDVGGARAEAPAEAVSLRVGRVAAPLREQVLDVLRRAIVDLRLQPGHRLIERELVEQIGVSRTTVREALRQLSAEGLVETIPQKGAVVAAPSAQEAAELYEVRAALEALACRRFAERASDEQVSRLRDALTEIEHVTDERGDIPALLRAKRRFYDALLEGSGNAAISSILEGLQARVSALRTASLSQPGRPARSAAEIEAIVVAVEARDPDAAAGACTHHVEQAAAAGLKALASAEVRVPELA
jgi:DNA-binding GntR family transcriptional regulator